MRKMRFLHRILKLAAKEPFGCLCSLALSAAVIGAFAAAFSYVIFSIWAVSLVKNNIEDATGFRVSAQNIAVNLFTGKCEIDDMHIVNPSVYDMREIAKKNTDTSPLFLLARKVEMQLSPLDLIKGDFTVSSLSAEISELNCIRLNNSTSNLPEFLANMLKCIKVRDEFGKPVLGHFSLKIKNAKYTDFSATKDTILWKMRMNFEYKRDNLSDFTKSLREIKEVFEKANAPFISNSLNSLSNEIL